MNEQEVEQKLNELEIVNLDIESLLQRAAAIQRKIVDAEVHASTTNYSAEWKPGRKSTNHQQAVLDAGIHENAIQEFTTIKTTVAWAKLTKREGLNLIKYTTQEQPTFVIKRIK